jgi:hypothetical protein
VLVGVESGFIDMLIWAIVALVSLLIIAAVERAVHEHRTTRDAKNVDATSHKKGILALAAGLDQYADLVPVDQVTPEGIVQTKHGKGKNKTTVEYQLPECKIAPLPKVADGKDPEKTRSVIQMLFNSVSKHSILRSAKVPIVGLVWDKGIAVGLPGLGALSFLQKMEKLQNLQGQIAELKKAEYQDKFKDLVQWLEETASGWSLIDFNAVRNSFHFAWDQTRRRSQNQWHEDLGERRKAKSNESFKTLLLYFGVFLAGLAALIAVVAIFFG